MEDQFLTIKEVSKSPLQTIAKVKKNKKLNIDDLTYELPLTSDDIFHLFYKNNEEIMTNLLNSKDLYISDWSCPYSREHKRYYFNQRCKGCQILYRLRKGNSQNQNEIEIYSGSKKGNKLLLEKFDFFKDDYLLNLETEEISHSLFKTLNPIYYHLSKKNSYYNIENSKVNYITQSLIYNQIMKQENLQLYNNYTWSYICGNKIHLLYEKDNIPDLKELSGNPLFSVFHSPNRDIERFRTNGVSKIVILAILKQLTMTFKIMGKYHFIHSKPGKDFYHFIPEPITVNKETFPLKLILKCHEYSSITYQDRRFYCSSVGNFHHHGLPLDSIDVDVNGSDSYCENKHFTTEYNGKRILFYKIGKRSELFLKLRNQYGIPLCFHSFDFVMFLISLVIQEEFYVFREMKEYKLWKSLWKSEEYLYVEKKLFSLENNNFDSIYQIVKDYYIRFDALQFFYQSLIV